MTMGRYRNVRGKISEIISDDMVLVDVMVPARLAVRASEVRVWREPGEPRTA